MIIETPQAVMIKNSIITAFFFVAVVMWVSYWLSDRLTRGRVHGSAIAIAVGLLLAYVGGVFGGGSKGIADIPMLTGVGILGGAMFRDFAIVATAFGADLESLRKAGWVGAMSVILRVVISFIVGGLVAVLFGYTDVVLITTIGEGAATYIVGPVTGTALGAESDVIARSVAAGLVKSVLVIMGTPFVAKSIELHNPLSAMIYVSLRGDTGGVSGGLATADSKLVTYGAMTATLYTGMGCLLAPSLLLMVVRSFTD